MKNHEEFPVQIHGKFSIDFQKKSEEFSKELLEEIFWEHSGDLPIDLAKYF